MKKLLVLVGLLLAGCSDASRAQFGFLGGPADVTCYSGGRVIYVGRSTGKVTSGGYGLYFQESVSLRVIRVFGACVVRN